MNLNKQQLGAVANKIFNQLEEIRLAKIEELKPSILEHPIYLQLVKKCEDIESCKTFMHSLSSEIEILKKELGLTGYSCYLGNVESIYLSNKINLPQVRIEDIKNELILASIEQDNLTELIETVTTKFNQ